MKKEEYIVIRTIISRASMANLDFKDLAITEKNLAEIAEIFAGLFPEEQQDRIRQTSSLRHLSNLLGSKKRFGQTLKAHALEKSKNSYRHISTHSSIRAIRIPFGGMNK